MERHCFILFGSTGDLTKKKLLPALRTTLAKQDSPFPILCIGRRELSQKEYLEEAGISDWEESFLKHIHYFRVDFRNPPVKEFLSFVEELQERYSCGKQYLFYLSLPSSVFSRAIDFIEETGLKERAEGVKLAFEKPFGNDLESAKELKQKVESVFDDSNVFLVDHYLGKDFVQNLLVLRFANRMLDRVWSAEDIESVQIVMSETSGVKGRGEFYEETGVIRDVVQNHLLQLIALVGMDPPKEYDFDKIKEQKSSLLKRLKQVPSEDIVIGQYESGNIYDEKVPGYREEEEVSPDSEQATFIAFRCFLDHPRWRDVPWYVKTGKRLSEDRVEIDLFFRKPETLFQQQHHTKIRLCLKPESLISILFLSKKIGKQTEFETEELEFCFSCGAGNDIPAAYQVIFDEISKGSHAYCVSWEEVFLGWRFAEDLIEQSKLLNSKGLCFYSAGSQGPQEAKRLIERSDREWI